MKTIIIIFMFLMVTVLSDPHAIKNNNRPKLINIYQRNNISSIKIPKLDKPIPEATVIYKKGITIKRETK